MNIQRFLVYKNKTFLAIIPARGGSKRIPKKNLLDLNGKPLIAYSIEAGLNSKYIDKVIVTTDNTEIIDVSRTFGVDSIKRPDNISDDTASTFEAIKHTIEKIDYFDYVILLQPTSPLRDKNHIDEAIELREKKNADAIISVSEMTHNPLWSNTLPKNLSLVNFLDDNIKNLRSQDLKNYYMLNGAIYICRIDKLLDEKTLFIQNNIFAYEMKREDSIDIDEYIDFKLAEVLMNEKKCL